MEVAFVDLGRQYRSIQEEIDAVLLETVRSSQFVLGAEVSRFEREFAEYCEAAHCVGLNSGTAALHLSLEALDVGPGDELIAPANTFIATVLPALKLGARPVLVDCDPETATIDVQAAEAAVSARTKAVIAVHLYGQPADMDPLVALCEERGLALIEDACQAHGARYKGRRTGSLGSIAAFSFYPSKNLGAYGDAGAVTTNSNVLAEKLRLLRDLGQERKYLHVLPGWNERIDTLHAAVLRVKLRHLDRWNGLRRAHAVAYATALAGMPLALPTTAPWAEHVWHLYVVRSPRRDEIRAALDARQIATGLHYPLPLHLQPALRDLGYSEGDFPVAEAWSRELLSLPMFAELESPEIDAVASAVGAALASAAA